MYINTQTEFENFIARAKSSELLAIDTEFMREKSYFPQLCLLQMATEEEDVIVDPFAINDLAPLSSLLLDASIVKLFHAGSQDIEILFHELGVVPTPVFDTQIAAAVLGHSLQIGYGSLVSTICGTQLKKGDSYTDWARRPLSKSQLAYAADDVIYLPKMYRIIHAKLVSLGRLEWLTEDFAELANPKRYEILPFERYKKLKRVNQLSRRQLSAARELAAWREQTAMRRDLPRKWVLTDEQIVEACKREPKNIDQLLLIRGMSEKLSTKDARAVLHAIQTGLNVAENLLPNLTIKKSNEKNVEVEVDALSAIARLRAKENNIAFQALVSISDLTEIARGHTNCAALKGWRREIVGQDLLAFARGETEIQIIDGELKVTKRQ